MNFEYSLNNALNWGNFSYHYDKSREGASYSTLHAILAALEFLPLVSQSVSLIEFGIVSLIGVVEKNATSNLESDTISLKSDKISSIAKNTLKTSQDEAEKSTEKKLGISSDNSVSHKSSPKSLSENSVELSALSEKEQTKIIIAAENLATNLASNFHRQLLAYILRTQESVSDARKNLSHLNEEEMHQRNRLINEVEARIKYLSSREQNIKCLIKLYFKNYFTSEIPKQLEYKLPIIFFTISDYHPKKWLTDIFDACCEAEHLDKKTKEIFGNFFFAKHEFRLSANLDFYEEIIDGKTYKNKIS